MDKIILWGIMLLVFVGLPILLGKLSGKSPMEMVFGARIQDTLFGKDSGAKKKKTPTPKTGSRQDLMDLVSSLVSYARRNQVPILVPGTIQQGGKTATLAAILITKGAVVGFNCFGYGGEIQAYAGDAKWAQLVGEEKVSFDSPVVKNREQLSILKDALKEAGYPQVPCQVLGVFTARSAILRSTGRTGCYQRNEIGKKLAEDLYLKDKGLPLEEIRAALDPMILRTQPGKAAKA